MYLYFTSMKIKTAIITLNPGFEKVHELSRLLADQDLRYEVVLAADGREEFPLLEEGEHLDQSKSLKMRLVELTKSEVGCYLSHFRTIKKAYNAGLKRICIIEDDVLIEPDFSEVLDSLEALPEEFEHIRLMGLKRHRRKIICQLDKRHQLTRPVKGLCGTQGYVLNRSGMEKVLQQGCVISEPIDKFYDHFWDIDLKSYCVEPHIIWERPIVESSIVKKSRDNAVNSSSKLLRKYAVKLRQSFKRRVHILKHWNDFLPAEKSAIPMGKTARIR